MLSQLPYTSSLVCLSYNNLGTSVDSDTDQVPHLVESGRTRCSRWRVRGNPVQEGSTAVDRLSFS